MIRLDGKPFRLYDYPFYKDIYDRLHTKTLLKCGRQVAKSTSIVNWTTINACAIPHFQSLYIAPLRSQATYFSKSRVQKSLLHSPLIKREYIKSAMSLGVWNKQFTNGSEMHFSYAGDDPDRIRGISTDQNNYDEVQDIIYDLVIPVVNETMAESDYAFEVYCGTPKSNENTIEWLWQRSTQCEWIMKCEGCNKYNYCDSVRCIGKKGIICINCGKYLNPRLGFWHPLKPPTTPEEWKYGLWGYHISQLILPKNNENARRWYRILEKLEGYPEVQFNNEVLGISVAEGTRFITLKDLRNQCRPYAVSYPPPDYMVKDVEIDIEGRREIYAGIDWSGAGEDGTSRTVLWIWGVVGSESALKTLYYRVFPKREPVLDIKDIVEICKKFRVKLIGADAGGGAHANSFLREAFGEARVVQFQYGSYQQHFSKGANKILIDKTAAIDTFMTMIKRERVYYPHKDQCEIPFNDTLNLHTEITKHGAGVRVWTRTPNTSDDCLHAQVFGWLASDIARGRLVLYGTEKERFQLAA